jgi:hypothetical protein
MAARPGKDLLMRPEEARQGILREWKRWTTNNVVINATGMHGLRFYAFLENERPHLLAFTYSGTDKSQQVQAWLKAAGAIKD